MTGFDDAATAARMRDIIETVTRGVIAKERPENRIGKVYSFNTTDGTAQILFAGETVENTVKVRFAQNMIPKVSMDTYFSVQGYDSPSDVVRVAGKPGNYFILDYIFGVPEGIPAAGSEPLVAYGTITQYYRGDKVWATLNPAAVGAEPALPSTTPTGKVLRDDKTWVTLSYEAPLAAGTTAQYYRGDKTWQALNVAAVVGAAPLASPALTGSPTVNGSGIELTSNKSTSTTLGSSNTFYPTQLAVKTYVDTADATKEPVLAAGTTAQYYRGDKTWQTLNPAAAGLGNVANLAQMDLVNNQTAAGLKTFSNYVTALALRIGTGALAPSDGQLRLGGTAPALYFDRSGVQEWLWYNTGGSFYVRDIINARMLFEFNPGAAGVASVNINDQTLWRIATASTVGTILRAATSQTADLSQNQNVGGTPLSGIKSDGAYWMTTVPVSDNSTKVATTAAVTTALAAKENSITAGTTAQYWRGDKTWQTLDVAGVSGLTAALALKAPLASPAFTGTVTGVTAAMVGLGSVANVLQYSASNLPAFGNITGVATLAQMPAGGTSTDYMRGDKTWQTLNAAAVGITTDAAAGVGSLRTLGNGALNAAPGNHLHSGVYEPVVTAGISNQYWRGDKTWQTLNPAAVGAEPLVFAGTTGQYYRGDKAWATLDFAAISGSISAYQLPLQYQPDGGQQVTDWNSANKPGFFNSDAAASNKPSPSSGIFAGWVVKWGSGLNSIVQYVVNINTVNTSWRRVRDFGGTWGSWVQIFDTAAEIATIAEPPVAAGTSGQLWRGDKVWQTISALTLSQFDNTSALADGQLPGRLKAAGFQVTNFNTVPSPGFFYAGSSGSGTLNTPTVESTTWLCWSTVNGASSVITVYAQAAVSGEMYRRRYNGSWAAWERVYMTATEIGTLFGSGGGAESYIVPGTTAQYWRGDKTWQTLNPAAVGLANHVPMNTVPGGAGSIPYSISNTLGGWLPAATTGQVLKLLGTFPNQYPAWQDMPYVGDAWDAAVDYDISYKSYVVRYAGRLWKALTNYANVNKPPALYGVYWMPVTAVVDDAWYQLDPYFTSTNYANSWNDNYTSGTSSVSITTTAGEFETGRQALKITMGTSVSYQKLFEREENIINGGKYVTVTVRAKLTSGGSSVDVSAQLLQNDVTGLPEPSASGLSTVNNLEGAIQLTTSWATYQLTMLAANAKPRAKVVLHVSKPGTVANNICIDSITIKVRDYETDIGVADAVGVGNLTLSGTQTVDGVSCTEGMVVLAAAQSTQANNGPWLVKSGAWIRAPWANTSDKIAKLHKVYVKTGTTYGGTEWVTTWKSTNTLDVSLQVWTSPGIYLDYTCTCSLQTGTPTSAVATNAKYTIIGRTVIGYARLQFVTVAGSSGPRFTLPVPARSGVVTVAYGRESQTTGVMIYANLASASVAQMVNYANVDPGVGNRSYEMSFQYEMAYP